MDRQAVPSRIVVKRRVGIFQMATGDAGASSPKTERLLDTTDVLLAEGQHDGSKKALLIGCKYSHNRNFSELELPHRDIEGVKNMLIDTYQFEEENIAVLLDDSESGLGRPTKDNILSAIDNFMLDVRRGDTLYFHYSGHGEQVKCKHANSTELDGLDEAIVPCDVDSCPVVTCECNDWIYSIRK